jgi:hypothetical protein
MDTFQNLRMLPLGMTVVESGASKVASVGDSIQQRGTGQIGKGHGSGS